MNDPRRTRTTAAIAAAAALLTAGCSNSSTGADTTPAQAVTPGLPTGQASARDSARITPPATPTADTTALPASSTSSAAESSGTVTITAPSSPSPAARAPRTERSTASAAETETTQQASTQAQTTTTGDAASTSQDPGSAEGLTPPRLSPQAADFADPVSVATQYLSVWCYLPPAEPANTNIAAAASWVTAAGWDDDKSRAIGEATWMKIQDAGTITVCGPVTGELVKAAPSTDRRKYVALYATRYQLDPAGTAVVDSDELAVQRRVLRADDGRWLVDVKVEAG